MTATGTPASDLGGAGGLKPGDMVGPYRIDRLHKNDGTAEFYVVTLVAKGRSFMFKILLAELAKKSAFVLRLKSEATMLAKLRHPNVISITDFGMSGARPYLVFEAVDGGSLDDWFAANSTGEAGAPAAAVKPVIEQVLAGLAYAHQTGIVHRNLAPPTILMTRNSEVKISDFFLAREIKSLADVGREMDTSNSLAIKSVPGFLSPEHRDMTRLDPRTDIYAVGVLTYYLLTNKKPSGRAQPVTRVVPSLAKTWDIFIATCLAEDPDKRYRSADAALKALQNITVSPPGGLLRRLFS